MRLTPHTTRVIGTSLLACNDFAALRAHAPQLAKVCFNGKTAGRFAPVIAAAGYTTLVLPSSSPANAMLSFDQKLRLWRDILT